MLAMPNTDHEITQRLEIDQLIAKWDRYLNRLVRVGKLAQTTAPAYHRGLSKLLDYCDQEGVEIITTDVILDWQGSVLESGKKAATANAWLSGAKAFYEWAEMKGMHNNPAKHVKGAKRSGTNKRHKRLALTDVEILRVLDLPDRETPAGIRDRAILYLMAFTGVRGISIHRVNLEDVRNQNGQMVLDVTGKGHIEADDIVVLVNPALQTAMYDWLAARRQLPRDEKYIAENGSPLFVSFSDRSMGKRLSTRAIRGLVKKYYGIAGIKDELKTTHSLRHSAITAAVKNGAPIQKVQSMAGHASVETTMIYFHEADRIGDPAEGYITYGEQPTHQEPF